jgi:hypothetical protein
MSFKQRFKYSDLPIEKALELRGIADTLAPLLNELRPKALKAGQQLRVAREIVGHGNFGSFCHDFMKTSVRMCQYLITIADLADEIGADLVEQMPASSAAALSSAPAEIVSQIVDEIKVGGKCPSVRQIKKRSREARGNVESAATMEHDDERIANVALILTKKLEKQELADLVDLLNAAHECAIVALCGKINSHLASG